MDKENWSFAYNTSDLRWVIDDSVLQHGYTYVFRVLAENNNGIGEYSVDSDMFSYPSKSFNITSVTSSLTLSRDPHLDDF